MGEKLFYPVYLLLYLSMLYPECNFLHTLYEKQSVKSPNHTPINIRVIL